METSANQCELLYYILHPSLVHSLSMGQKSAKTAKKVQINEYTACKNEINLTCVDSIINKTVKSVIVT